MATPEFIVSLRQKIGHEQLWLPGVSITVVDDAGRLLLGRRTDNGQWAVVSGIPEPLSDSSAARIEAGLTWLADPVPGARFHPAF